MSLLLHKCILLIVVGFLLPICSTNVNLTTDQILETLEKMGVDTNDPKQLEQIANGNFTFPDNVELPTSKDEFTNFVKSRISEIDCKAMLKTAETAMAIVENLGINISDPKTLDFWLHTDLSNVKIADLIPKNGKEIVNWIQKWKDSVFGSIFGGANSVHAHFQLLLMGVMVSVVSYVIM